jgi:hypothetical protein
LLKRILTVAHVRSSTAGVEVMFCESARIYSLSPGEKKDHARLVEALQQAERAQRAVTVWLKDLDSDQIIDIEP